MRFELSYLSRIRERTRMPDIVGRDVTLKKSGAHHIGRCPFHDEKTGSFAVYDDHAHCYGCGWHGDIIKWGRDYLGLSFLEAVKWSAVEAGLGDPTPMSRRERKRQQRQVVNRQQAKIRDQKQKQDRVAKEVGLILQANTERAYPHPYLEAKGFPGVEMFIAKHRWYQAPMPSAAGREGLRPYITGTVERNGETVPVISTEGWLLVPIRNTAGVLRSMQYIAPNGTKLFHPGGEVKGCYHKRGGHYRDRELWLCEGFATALSIELALFKRSMPAEVRVCFSASNLGLVGRIAMAEERRAVMAVPDNDANGVGAKAAEQSGCRYWLPPIVGMDANDYHRAQGITALGEALCNLRFFRIPG